MKPPRFSDLHRFSAPYKNSGSTNVAETFARARAELAARERVEAEIRLRSTITTLKRKA